MSYYLSGFRKLLKDNIKNKNVLHIGCVGTMSDNDNENFATHKFLINNSSSVYGIDINNDGIEKMKKNGFSCELADASFYSSDIKFDVIACLSTLQFTDNPFITIKNLKNNLKQNGVLIVEVPNIFSFSNLFRNWRKFGRMRNKNVNGQSPSGELSIFDSSLLFNILFLNDFFDIKIMTFPARRWTKNRKVKDNLRIFLNNLLFYFSNKFGPSLVAIAVKK